MKNIDKHLLSAMDNYPYSLYETIESLEFALSYDHKNTMALCLLGRIHAEQLFDYETAKEYFSEALSHNLHALEIYPHYIHTLILNEDYDEAENLIEFALTVKGINKVEILLKKVFLFEVQKELEAAKKTLKEIENLLYDSYYDNYINETKKRIKSKLRKLKKRKIEQCPDNV